MRSIFPAIVFTLGSLSFSNVNQINAQTQKDEAAIRQAVATMTTAFNTRDDQASTSVTSADADFVTVTGSWSKSPLTTSRLGAPGSRQPSRTPQFGTLILGFDF
jgi:hypothetical protein